MRAVAPLHPHAQRANIGRGWPATAARANSRLAVSGQLLELPADDAARHRHLVQLACLLDVVGDERLQRRVAVLLHSRSTRYERPPPEAGRSVIRTQPLMRWP